MILIQENDDRFYIKQSTISKAGKGLFAKIPLKKDDFLEIIGVMVERGSAADQCTTYANSYKFATDERAKYNIVPIGYAGLINHADKPERQNVEIRYLNNHKKRNNAADKAVYWFLRDIQKDEELLGNYGKDWDRVLDWVQHTPSQSKEDWEVFLEYDLYNLNTLKEV